MAISIGEIEATLRLRDELTSQLKFAQSQLAATGEQIQRVGRQVKEAGSVMTLGLTLPLVAAATAALKFSTDFETAMVKVGNLTNIGAAGIKEMRAEILKLSPQVAIGPKELAAGLLTIASTGLQGAEALDVLQRSAKATAVGLGETKDVGRAVTAAIKAYGSEALTAEQATNKLFVAVREGGAETNEMASQLGRVVGVAKQMGISFDEVLASVATFTRLGVDAATATTGLRATIIAMLHPSKQAVETLQEMGTSIDEVRKVIREKGLAVALQELLKLADGDADAIGRIIPEARALASVLGTAGALGEDYTEVLKTIKTSTGDLDAAFEETSKTLGFRWNAALAQAQIVLLQFGDAIAPTFGELLKLSKPVLEFLSKLVSVFESLPGPVKAFAIGVGILLAALGPGVWILGSWIQMAGFAVTGFSALSKVLFGAAEAEAAVAVATGAATAATTASTAATVVDVAATIAATEAKAAYIAALYSVMIAMAMAQRSQLLLGSGMLLLEGQVAAVGLGMGAITGDVIAVGEVIEGTAIAAGEAVPAMGLLEGALAALTGPIGWFIGAAALALTASGSWGAVGRILKALADILADRVIRQFELFSQAIKALSDATVQYGSPIINFLDEIFGISSAGEGIKKGLTLIAEGLERFHGATKGGGKEKDSLAQAQAAMDAIRKKALAASAGGINSDKTLDQGISLNVLNASFTSLTDRLDDAKKKLAEFSKAQLDQIKAGKEMGLSADDITESLQKQWPELHATTAAVQLYKDKLEGANKAMSEAKRMADEQKGWKEDMRNGYFDIAAAVEKMQDKVDDEMKMEGVENVRQHIQAITSDTEMFDVNANELQDTLNEIANLSGLSFSLFNDQELSNVRTFSEAVEDIPKLLVNAFTGGGGVKGAFKAIGSDLGATLMSNIFGKPGSDKGLLKNMKDNAFGKLIGGMIPIIGGMVGPLIDVMLKVFDHRKKDFKRMGKELGVELSDELIEQMRKDSKKFGGEAQALLLNLDKVIGEAGGIAAFGIDKAIAKTRDLFVMLETGALKAKDVGGVFDRVFAEILPNAISKTTGLAKESFLDLIKLAQRFGVETEKAMQFLRDQSSKVSDGLNMIAAGTLGIGVAAQDNIVKMGEQLLDARDKAEKLEAQIKDLNKKPKSEWTEKQKISMKLWQAQLIATRREIDTLVGNIAFAEKGMADFAKSGQEGFDRVGRLAVVAFVAGIGSGKTFLEVMEEIGPALDDAADAADQFGFKSTGAFKDLVDIRRFIKDNKELVGTLAGVNNMMVGLKNSSLLTQDTFTDLTTIARETFDKMVKGGLTSNQALILMQPTLQTIWELQTDFGFAVDDATQKLIDEGIAAGIVGQQHRSAADKMVIALDRVVTVLELMATFFGVTIPDAVGKTNKAIDGIPTPPVPSFPDAPPVPDWDAAAAQFGGLVRNGDVQHFVRGGTALARGRDTVPALLAPGETIRTPQQEARVQRDLEDGGGGSTVVQIFLDKSEIASVTVDGIAQNGKALRKLSRMVREVKVGRQ